MSVNTWQTPNTWGGAPSIVLITATETKSERVCSSALSIDAESLAAIVTELKKARTNLSTATIKKDINVIVTEIKASRADLSLLDIPVVIIINPRNIIRVKRKSNIIRIK